MGIHVVMLTGDNERTARAIGAQAGVDEVIAGVLPDGKESVIRQLKKKGKVAMVGDGINDAPALTRADIGIAIGAGTDVAIDAADVVLMKSRLSDVPAAIRLSRATLRNIHQNLFWAFFYNACGIPLACGVFVPLGLTLNPMFGAAAMSLSSFFVVTNALRLNLFKVHDASKDKKIARKMVEPAAEAQSLEKVIKIEGLMCGHCESTVKTALEAIPEVEEAVASHVAGNAIVTLKADVADEVLKKAVEGAGYIVHGIAARGEEEEQKKTIKIEGLMCSHCENTVKTALEAISGVEEAVASHTAGNAVVTLSAAVADDDLKKAVEGAGYVVLGIE